jgi:hypothetical protein
MKEGYAMAAMATATTKPYKAIIAAVLAGLTALIATVTGESDKLNSVNDWVIIIVAAVVTGAATYTVPNPPTGA